MDNESIVEGIRLFAERARARLNRTDDLLFEATFPGETYPT